MDATRRWRPTLVLLATVLIFAASNPVGFIGGGQDDGRYLHAARCWSEYWACLPANHWQARWPVFAPISLFIALFGESRFSVELWPIICSLIASWLLVEIALRVFGYRTALIVGLAFVATPAFSLQLLTPSVEAIELAFVLAAILCLLKWAEQRKSTWMFASGLLFGLAFQVRETSIVAAGLAAVLIFAMGFRPRRDDMVLGLTGFFLPLAAEFLIYHQLTGDFLYRRHLSLAHTRIASSELSRAIDTSGWPLLNPDIIAGWRREPGFHVHWLVDGPLNFLLNAKSGFSLLLTPLLLVVGRRNLSHETRRAAWTLLGLAATYIFVLTYVLAMDPKPRVMLTALAASSLAFALVVDDLWRHRQRLLAITCLASTVIAGAVSVAGYVRPAWADRQARAWNAKYPNAIEADRMTKLMLTLNPDIRELPDFSANRPYAMVISLSNCHEWTARGGLSPELLAIEGEKRLSIIPNITGSGAWICLFKYRQPIPPETMNQALNRTWGKSDKIGG